MSQDRCYSVTSHKMKSHDNCGKVVHRPCSSCISSICKKAKLQARIKPTALCSAIDKENLIESLLDLLHYIYNYYHSYAPCLPQSSCLSADFFVTCYDCDYVCQLGTAGGDTVLNLGIVFKT